MLVKEIKINTEKGFTLVETLVAISVLLVSLAGPLSIASQGLAAARIARDQLVASYLAQEGVEYIRSVRDSNILGNLDWLAVIRIECGSNGCTVDPNVTSNNINSCPGECPLLKYNESTGLYGYDPGVGWENSIFTRKVVVNEIVVGREAEIESSVSWFASGRIHTVTIRENILDWQ